MQFLVQQKDLRRGRRLDFCYLCGEPIMDGEPTNEDHCPPKSVFAIRDRRNVIKLRVHKACNDKESTHDERVAQLLGLMHGKRTSKDRSRLQFHVARDSRGEVALSGVSGVDLVHVVKRWIRGCHALLYGIPLSPTESRVALTLPFPTVRSLQHPQFEMGMQPTHRLLVQQLTRQYQCGRIDRIRAYAGKFEYRCFWSNLDDGKPCCIFTMRVYNWEDLGKTKGLPKRGCVGLYWSDDEPPPNAATTTSVVLPKEIRAGLDPFSDGLLDEDIATW